MATQSKPPAPSNPKRVEQSRLVLDEIRRQLAEVSTRQASAISRAAIIVAAELILTTVVLSGMSTPWLLASVALASASGGFGLRAIWLWKSSSAVLTQKLAKDLLDFDANQIEDGFLRDGMKELNASRRDLDRKNWNLRRALWLLTISWASALILGTLAYFEMV